MTIRWDVLPAVCLFLLLFSCGHEQKRVLIYIPHDARPSATVPLDHLLTICGSEKILADTSSSDAALAEDSLQRYHVVVFSGISPGLLGYRQQNDLERYVQSGAGIIHA